jgi:transposase-like protein
MIKFAIDIFGDAADRFEAAQAAVLQEWQLSCGCEAPGLRPECRTCLDCQQLKVLTQMKLSAIPEAVFPATASPKCTYPHPPAIREEALALYAQGCPLSEIQAKTGVGDRRTLRRWAKAAGLPPRLVIYPAAMRAHCLHLYQSGKRTSKIEALTGVPADTIKSWVHDAGLVRHPFYSAETKRHCLALYQQGKTPNAIEGLTQVPASRIRQWAASAQISRSAGRPPQYLVSVRDQCLLLRQEGKDYREIAVLTGVSESTVRKWVKQALFTKHSDEVAP